MRIGYVGLSTPLFYDFKSQGKPLPNERSAPNPILDGPWGIFLLFDEVWFLTRPLCPRNLREAGFVRFMDEENLLPEDLAGLHRRLRENRDQIIKNCYQQQQLDSYQNWSTDYWQKVRKVGVTWDAAPDNHSHGVMVNGTALGPNSANLDNVIFDLALIRSLGPHRLELITNTFTKALFFEDTHPQHQQELTQAIVIDDISSFVIPEGPYHPCVEEIRDIPELIDFRRWLSSQPATVSPQDAKQRSEEVRRRIEEEKSKAYLDYLSSWSQVKNFATTVITTAADKLVDFSGPLIELATQWREINDVKKKQWQAFILKSDELLKSRSPL